MSPPISPIEDCQLYEKRVYIKKNIDKVQYIDIKTYKIKKKVKEKGNKWRRKIIIRLRQRRKIRKIAGEKVFGLGWGDKMRKYLRRENIWIEIKK